MPHKKNPDGTNSWKMQQALHLKPRNNFNHEQLAKWLPQRFTVVKEAC
jgi:hypothetical protein